MDNHFHIIYETINLINGKKYIGKHKTCDLNDDYLGSGIAISRAILKYGKECFTRKILFVFDNEEDANNKEKELVTLEIIKDEKFYNIALGGYGGCIVLREDHPKYYETKKKLKEAAIRNSEQTRQRTKELHKAQSVGMYGRKQSDYQKQRVSEIQTGRIRSEESIQKHRDSLKKTQSEPGYIHPLKGRIVSEEHRENMRGRDNSNEKNGMFGRTHSEEAKAKQSAKAKNRPKSQCPHCNLIGNVTNMKRWHFDNCKKSKNV